MAGRATRFSRREAMVDRRKLKDDKREPEWPPRHLDFKKAARDSRVKVSSPSW